MTRVRREVDRCVVAILYVHETARRIPSAQATATGRSGPISRRVAPRVVLAFELRCVCVKGLMWHVGRVPV